MPSRVTSVDLSNAIWRKSSKSGGNDGNCVELAALGAARWCKSSRSGAGNSNCVELAFLPATVAVRDSKDVTGPVLTFTPEDWRAFVAAQSGT
ncbi:toxin [Longispora fulva]|uniref:DUF397 domain-containing protein n=1 Tax=Longispora fulva TaxID=619741 RepID=A0A8J7GXI0_9ACTN|nr:DUF397 domain-containing protein [Longispora fulva]MBG6140924.1 hypothetical protein [Longispora fulva]GIG60810.1 toxin [Longispora fulva]